MIAIIDYDMGNLGSIKNMIKKVGGDSIITNNREIIDEADGIILPGVGSFDAGVENLKKYELFDYIKDSAIHKKKPILGICLGMQLMTLSSAEGKTEGLGLVDGLAKKFSGDENLKIPYMGWNFVEKQKNSVLFDTFEETPKFYFVHSYYVQCVNRGDVAATSNYSMKFDSAFEKGNILGVQFHPEKSHRYGMTLMKGFLKFVDTYV
ncbi:imidazole glycerol phosphate synthase subunit HisH [Daejeonella lutea]|uniref:Imidazole glycerol phosphate synthase subunit HisH n=1 Tax=Daejeonella lutea TaxID=572036 RepID=A0A1T5FB54_9SPHI|nr:imidazole glycerol phosphate synthase subunit HisH [Daejeonella lutea]SKB93372.1 glutamine amidotransferase [Daejeonella lutea]